MICFFIIHSKTFHFKKNVRVPKLLPHPAEQKPGGGLVLAPRRAFRSGAFRPQPNVRASKDYKLVFRFIAVDTSSSRA